MTNLKSIPKRHKPSVPQPGKLANDQLIARQVRAVRSVAGLLNDLTPDQMEKFDEAVKRRPLFGQ